ncbi:reprolysin-like metallopeptidase [Pseudoflavitalea sp. G-6-1-2]|uniref:reprolysin-like metallopeptidase n=1 Tax=Pseudoflavitalea sp. G-6-1-2 TaxID=2728841 RepID=UPI001F0D6886|nr:zinc-dependent metalloprotease family protein [Pseudoflavitalea sp. G-6-1-2]
MAIFCQTILHAQDYWRPHTAAAISIDKAAKRFASPNDFKLFELNFAPLKTQAFKATGKGAQKTIISLPNADGQIEQFEVVEASNFEPALQAKFPDIRSFSGKGISDKYATLKLSISPQGIQTVVFRTEKENEFIEPYSADHKVYAVFRKQALQTASWKCFTPDQKLQNSITSQVNSSFAAAPGGLKTLRLAQSVTAEYSNYFGATNPSQVALVLAAVNATLTRCNGVFERDLSLHLNLIASTTDVFYYDAATDPYSAAGAGASGLWNDELQYTLSQEIGAANYDIGHLFGASGGGGNAGCIGCVCDDNSKGKGFTSPADNIPQGDNFDIDYVAHEMGHQLGANHTFSYRNEQLGTSVEPGSGITIMGYAGITGMDLAPHSISYFHAISIQQIHNNLSKKSCPVVIPIASNNGAPVANSGGNFTIPVSTPFVLKGSGLDPNAGDQLTYSWEQIDNASPNEYWSFSVAKPDKQSGSNFISNPPTASPVRYFPKMATILKGDTVSGPLPGGSEPANTEALSSVGRILKFRLTVRDNAPYSSATPVSVGQTNFADATVTVLRTGEPFRLVFPNGGDTWKSTQGLQLTWKVGNTVAMPIGVNNVKVSFSSDGGETYNTMIESTPNDGTESIRLPNISTTRARIKIEAIGNIFFDISDKDFTIESVPCLPLEPGDPVVTLTSPTSANVAWKPTPGAISYDVDFVRGLYGGNWLPVAAGITATSINLSDLTGDTAFAVRVRANCAAASSSYVVKGFKINKPPTTFCGGPNSIKLSNVTTSGATISWTAPGFATNYDFDYKLNTSATWISAAAGTSSTTISFTGLPSGTLYDYRVRTNCAGSLNGSSAYITGQFTTLVPPCETPFDVPTNGTISGAATIAVNTTIKGFISERGDIDHYKFVTTGGNILILLNIMTSDLDVKLLNSEGAVVAVADSSGTNVELLRATLTPGTYYVQVYGFNGGSSPSLCYSLRVNQSTPPASLESITADAYRADEQKAIIYPNPTKNIVNINFINFTGKSDLSLFDVNGRVVLSREIHSSSTSIDIAAFPTGVYVLKIKNGGKEVVIRKIVKE